ncbi:hypothetical protein [Streptomyces stackebrandtii]|uniref:hypothetical protein n=1 Tax=Streptomyces stackebrandtii TaxID=3051177 RepID=UPI0028DCC2AA|nr:hypothetical protein [Streptomyces sp. DSM 40976]
MTKYSVLYHYTDERGLEGIQATGYIDPRSDHAGRLGVEDSLIWLTDSDDPRDTGLLSDPTRTTVRIPVPAAGAIQYWPIWGVFSFSKGTLEKHGNPDSWYVCPTRLLLPGPVTFTDSGTPAPVAGEPVERWGPLPTEEDVNRLAAFVRDAVPAAYARYDEAGDEAGCVSVGRLNGKFFELLEVMQRLLDVEVALQRRRAGWRSLRAEVRDLPGFPDEWQTGLS